MYFPGCSSASPALAADTASHLVRYKHRRTCLATFAFTALDFDCSRICSSHLRVQTNTRIERTAASHNRNWQDDQLRWRWTSRRLSHIDRVNTPALNLQTETSFVVIEHVQLVAGQQKDPITMSITLRSSKGHVFE